MPTGFIDRYKQYKCDLKEDEAGATAAWHQAVYEHEHEKKLTAIASSAAVVPPPPRTKHNYYAVQKLFIGLRAKLGSPRAVEETLKRTPTKPGREWFYKRFVPWSTQTDK